MKMSVMKRRDCLKALGASAALLVVPDHMKDMKLFSADKETLRPPNVILIITDDQGYGDLACHGNSIIQTPAIDRLFTESIRLKNYHVSPECSPTRASLLTGRYSNRTGVWHTVMGRSLLRKDEMTMADVFQSNGFKTGIFGKWHLGDNYPFRPQDRGFDEVVINGGGGVGNTPDYWDNDYFDDTYWRNGKPEKFHGYCTDIWFDEAMKFVETNKNDPFFCYLTTNAPHDPFHIEDKYSTPYLDQGVPDYRAQFYGMITNIDENIAKLESKLKKLGIRDNTIFIFMTDNGTSGGVSTDENRFPTGGFNAGMRGQKGSVYDGGHRVPCFIRWPDGIGGGGSDVNRLTAHIDILPTLIELCELKTTEEVQFDGTSITPLLKDAVTNWPDRIIITDRQRIEHPEKWRRNVTMTDQWRLVNGMELYDMNMDPGQKNDVAEQYPDVVAKLRNAYERWWNDVSERFDEFCEIIIGSDKENPVRLTSHDLHDGQEGRTVVWDQPLVREALQSSGFWAIDVAQTGTYEFVLRRWPEEIDKPVNATIPEGGPIPGGIPYPKGRAINVTNARIKIAEVEKTKSVSENETAVLFRLQLQAGKTRLQTWFTDDKGQSRSAYYVYIRYLSQGE